MNDTTDTTPERKGPGPAFWGIGFALAVAVLATLRIAGVVGQALSFVILLGCALLLIPMIRSANRAARRNGCATPAGLRYNRGIGISSIAYVVGLGVALWIHDHHPDLGIWGYGLVLLPVLPIFGMIWVMGRYLVEETDEYLRHRAMIAALIGLGGVLGIGSAWGFLEMFELVPHAPGAMSVPVWAICTGLGQLWMRVRG